MTLTQVGGVLLIFILCPLLGGLPLIGWISNGLTGQKLNTVGTGNISVSAAFYHGGRLAGILAVLSEASKGIAAVLLARAFFPAGSAWEIMALIALVMGRYWISHGAGTTNVVWGYAVHDWVTAGLVCLIGGIGFTVLRERQLGKLGVLVLLSLITALRHPQNSALIGATLILSGLLSWIYQKIPDDLDLPTNTAQPGSRKVFRFFQGDRALLSLDQPLKADQVGQKAATLSQLKRWGYPVPMGWALPPGDDPAPLVALLQPTPEAPLVVRSSAIGEDSETASAAGQYESILHITGPAALEQAIWRCQASYTLPNAVRYRQDQIASGQTASDRTVPSAANAGMAVVVQTQVQGIFSGVAFSRDPISRQGEAVVIEALPGMATQVVSGQITPEQYRVWVRQEDIQAIAATPSSFASDWVLPDTVTLEMTATPEMPGARALPPRLIQRVAYLARHLEARYHGIPQDIEWSYDGQQLWLLQARPITTLSPIWTRKIAAEVIPGFIHPLTWSINRPLTCGAWGKLFTIVLGDRVHGLNFNETATLHNSAAYFNASLLGQLFQRMGLPPESLEFLTRGTKFNKPPLRSTLRNTPGLLRLTRLELELQKDFGRDQRSLFTPGLAALTHQPVAQLSPEALRSRIYQILKLLRRATYYSIMAPLSAALRQTLFRVKQADLDQSQTPEIASVRSLQSLAEQSRPLLADLAPLPLQRHDLLAALSETPAGQSIWQQFNHFLEEFGYLSDVATDIAVPTWKEDPRPVQDLFTQFLLNPSPSPSKLSTSQRTSPFQNWQVHQVQQRLNLKGHVTALYSKLLAELRWSFTALEQHWLASKILSEAGDIFFLEFDEIEQLLTAPDSGQRERMLEQIPRCIAARRSQLQQHRQLNPPLLVYGNAPPQQEESRSPVSQSSQQFQGIGASPGQVEGWAIVLQNLQTIPEVNRETILVVPYTDSGWAPLLAQAGGIIAEVGGQLSHGAIIAREYGIPAVMNVTQATQRLQTGQRVQIDGTQGTVKIIVA